MSSLMMRLGESWNRNWWNYDTMTFPCGKIVVSILAAPNAREPMIYKVRYYSWIEQIQVSVWEGKLIYIQLEILFFIYAGFTYVFMQTRKRVGIFCSPIGVLRVISAAIFSEKIAWSLWFFFCLFFLVDLQDPPFFLLFFSLSSKGRNKKKTRMLFNSS